MHPSQGRMDDVCTNVENTFIALGVFFFKTCFWFLNESHQAFMVSFMHYAIFIVGLYYFIYRAPPRSMYRIFFFAFLIFSALCYLTFDKCIMTHIELNICQEQNRIQKTIEHFFGNETEGNCISKTVLIGLTLFAGLVLLYDYGILTYCDNRVCHIVQNGELKKAPMIN